MTLTEFQSQLDNLYKSRNSKVDSVLLFPFTCPITNQTFKTGKSTSGFLSYYSNMSRNITKYQAKNHKTLTDEEVFDKFKSNIQKELKIKECEDNFKKISDLPFMQQWMNDYVLLQKPKLKPEELPVISVEKINLHKQRKYDKDLYVFFKIENIHKDVEKMFKGNLVDMVNAKKPGEVFLREYISSNPLCRSVYEFQNFGNTVKKVDMSTKPNLLKNKEYVELTAKIKDLNSQIHDLREKHKVVEERMSEIRHNTLENLTYDDYVRNQKNKVKKTLKP